LLGFSNYSGPDPVGPLGLSAGGVSNSGLVGASLP